MKLEFGKYYRTRDGRKVGPMFHAFNGGWRSRGSKFDDPERWKDDGSSAAYALGLIAEWTDTPEDGLLKNIKQAEEWADKQMSRASILDDAKQAVTQDRQDTHGKPEDTFALIAAYWSAHLDVSITGVDVCAMMALLKLARAKQNPMHADNWVDLAGYAACAGELANG